MGNTRGGCGGSVVDEGADGTDGDGLEIEFRLNQPG